MTEDEIKRIEDEMYRKMITEPEKEEEEILTVAEQVSQMLFFHPSNKAKFEFGGAQYTAGLTKVVKNFKYIYYMAVYDETNKKMINVEGEQDNNFTEIENYRAIVEAFLRDRVGRPKVEELEENDDYEEELL